MSNLYWGKFDRFCLAMAKDDNDAYSLVVKMFEFITEVVTCRKHGHRTWQYSKIGSNGELISIFKCDHGHEIRTPTYIASMARHLFEKFEDLYYDKTVHVCGINLDWKNWIGTYWMCCRSVNIWWGAHQTVQTILARIQTHCKIYVWSGRRAYKTMLGTLSKLTFESRPEFLLLS